MLRCVQFRVCSQPARRVVAKCRCIAVALGDHHCQLTVRRTRYRDDYTRHTGSVENSKLLILSEYVNKTEKIGGM